MLRCNPISNVNILMNKSLDEIIITTQIKQTSFFYIYLLIGFKLHIRTERTHDVKTNKDVCFTLCMSAISDIFLIC